MLQTFSSAKSLVWIRSGLIIELETAGRDKDERADLI